jgi:ornithine cyclodeaminase/alanine dehydrogenase-like protein (mu-crystallin family)
MTLCMMPSCSPLSSTISTNDPARLPALPWSRLGYQFEICPTCEAAVADSDIVYTCTNMDIGHEYIRKESVGQASSLQTGA